MYQIDYDADKALLTLRIWGFWTDAVTQQFVRDMAIATADARARGQAYRCISDAREFPVQSPEIVARFADMAERGTAARTAILVKASPPQMQARRSMANDRVRIFNDPAEAHAWIAADIG